MADYDIDAVLKNLPEDTDHKDKEKSLYEQNAVSSPAIKIEKKKSKPRAP